MKNENKGYRSITYTLNTSDLMDKYQMVAVRNVDAVFDGVYFVSKEDTYENPTILKVVGKENPTATGIFTYQPRLKEVSNIQVRDVVLTCLEDKNLGKTSNKKESITETFKEELKEGLESIF